MARWASFSIPILVTIAVVILIVVIVVAVVLASLTNQSSPAVPTITVLTSTIDVSSIPHVAPPPEASPSTNPTPTPSPSSILILQHHFTEGPNIGTARLLPGTATTPCDQVTDLSMDCGGSLGWLQFDATTPNLYYNNFELPYRCIQDPLLHGTNQGWIDLSSLTSLISSVQNKTVTLQFTFQIPSSVPISHDMTFAIGITQYDPTWLPDNNHNIVYLQTELTKSEEKTDFTVAINSGKFLAGGAIGEIKVINNLAGSIATSDTPLDTDIPVTLVIESSGQMAVSMPSSDVGSMITNSFGAFMMPQDYITPSLKGGISGAYMALIGDDTVSITSIRVIAT